MKFVKIVILGYLALFSLGFVLVHLFGIESEALNTQDLAGDFVWYRSGFYSFVLACWPKLSEWFVNRRAAIKLNDESFIFESEDSENKYRESVKFAAEKEIAYFRSIWWKVAVFFVVFEIAAVQKFWL